MTPLCRSTYGTYIYCYIPSTFTYHNTIRIRHRLWDLSTISLTLSSDLSAATTATTVSHFWGPCLPAVAFKSRLLTQQWLRRWGVCLLCILTGALGMIVFEVLVLHILSLDTSAGIRQSTLGVEQTCFVFPLGNFSSEQMTVSLGFDFGRVVILATGKIVFVIFSLGDR